MRRVLLATVLATLAATFMPASAEPVGPVPLPDPGILSPSLAADGRCSQENEFDYPFEEWYGSDCVRLRLILGPIVAKPGQNDVLLGPAVLDKGRWDGYMVRNKPGLVNHLNATPNTEDMHLHHGVYSAVGASYGQGAFTASGEEKNIKKFPQGYGQLHQGTDTWLFVHMIHNATAVPGIVYITWDFDYIPAEIAESKYGLKEVKSIWLDVGGASWHPDAEGCGGTCLNPIFNIQKGFGEIDQRSFKHIPGYDYLNDGLGRRVCAYPDENCARFNVNQGVSAQQGLDVSDAVVGKDTVIGASLADSEEGTLILIEGHVHPGGVRDEVSLARDLNRGQVDAEGNPLPANWVEKPIHVTDTIYFDHKGGVAPYPTSWNFAHGQTGKQYGWAVRVRKGDILRLNGVYDTHFASSYMQMGIVMAWMAPGDLSGVDVFEDDVYIDPGFPTTAPIPEGVTDFYPGGMCTPGLNAEGQHVLCLRGTVTHPSLLNNRNHMTGPCTPQICRPLPELDGPEITELEIAGFTYGLADINTIYNTGIPRIKLGQPFMVRSLDTAAYVWHSLTRCSAPCTGPTKVDYPLADASLGRDDNMDFDSADLGAGVGVPGNLDWTFTPDRTGTYTFFCRIHPFMRGAFKVVA